MKYSNMLYKLMCDVHSFLDAAQIEITMANRDVAYRALADEPKPSLCQLGYELLLSKTTRRGLPIIQLPFRGRLTATFKPRNLDFIVEYTGGVHLDEWLKQRPPGSKYRLLTWPQYERICADYHTDQLLDRAATSTKLHSVA
ncbi:hypothetical protein [Bowmanella sp. JS7-9]|uniref:Uncharacterized protein n=1 Tax=Pseudobowmanella zhangzhouensis TaxID=1537679 RepID=A0ABW1XLS3_9ALTE|nr:hypothetical protein [Bowmanella sp. JS7-9]TBX21907.1 hypothetical protein TK45_10465 [Bowmanella sp. JS7-9]